MGVKKGGAYRERCSVFPHRRVLCVVVVINRQYVLCARKLARVYATFALFEARTRLGISSRCFNEPNRRSKIIRAPEPKLYVGHS